MSNRDGLWTVLGIVGLLFVFYLCVGDARVSFATPVAAPASAPAVASAAATRFAPPAEALPAVRTEVAAIAPSPTPVAAPEALKQALDRLLAGKVVEFESASANLTPAGLRLLDDLVPLLAAEPDARVEVAGHTDDTGDANVNVRLSQRRAAVTLDHLVSRGIDRGRLEARGYGPARPIAGNDSEEGRRQNRRIEFNVLTSRGN